MKTYIVDDRGNKESVDWYDFLTNDNNPTLNRLTDELLKDPVFQKIIKDNQFNDDERTNS